MSVLVVFCFVLLLWFLFVCVFFLAWSPSHMDNIWTEYGSMLSFGTPKEETMQDAAQFVQLTQTLCYDLARAEKATDGKNVSVLVGPCPLIIYCGSS